ncbi:hypothetical protein CBR_g54039 [Chara braunii]|uniref:Uncharacterized protein n=1 Tax=Chara braunii TaxID=69332 RepID=A0A388MBQ6_CHABU|nr:hypothetical protein CBR_g54039 [Chara braunii]|eukprot:GBG91943.1 hypothetical protein CBR_g54039 [Chara braunii]
MLFVVRKSKERTWPSRDVRAGVAPAVTLKWKHKRGTAIWARNGVGGGATWLMTLEEGCRRLQVMVGELSVRSHEEPEDIAAAISLAGWVKNMADDMLDIIWELEEGLDPQLESCIDWMRAHGMMSTCYALFAEGRNLHYKLEERLMGDEDMEDENWQENGAQENKANSGVNTDNNNNNNINNKNDYNNNNDNDNNNRLSNNNNDNNNISNNNDSNNNNNDNNNNDNNNGHSDNDVSINNNNNTVNNYINNKDYNRSDDHGSSDAVGIGADNNNIDDGDDKNNNCDDGDGSGSDDGDRDVGIGDDNSDGDDNNNNYEDVGNDDGGGSGDGGGSNDHGSSRAESISTTGKKPLADVVGSRVDTDKRVICGVMCLARWGLGLKDQSAASPPFNLLFLHGDSFFSVGHRVGVG